MYSVKALFSPNNFKSWLIESNSGKVPGMSDDDDDVCIINHKDWNDIDDCILL